ncbi:PQQ-dependent sugar dehydrogenase [Chitinimonas viridis]|uniref:PQQ-dependent sugar dehydrogenase n=2 Tax=Chitinimonas viridis TaxID=664880 RepID=A0ABT8B273_9NEIS|nr:PQQ-dependent sugar dehydrogenase [Chitinimonas viridis]
MQSAPLQAATKLQAVTVARGLEHPWGLAFLPDGRMLVSERPGRLRLVARDGAVSAPLKGVPAVFASGQGGLLDVVLHPAFATNQWVYLVYAEPDPQQASLAGTAVARGKLVGEQLQGVQVLFRQQPKVAGGNHFGARLAFALDGRFFLAMGERFQRDRAQHPMEHLGKVVRLHDDGRVPADNPFVGRPGYQPEIWSLGHRNVQGAAIHPQSGQLWTAEHGAQGGDEINTPKAGRNYGWPVITYGRNYGGGKIGEGTAKDGMEQPQHYWDPSIAPSGMAFYTGNRYPGWRGSLLVGALRGQHVARLSLDGERVVAEEKLLMELGRRVRDVRQGPDGWVYLLTDAADGEVLRLELQ